MIDKDRVLWIDVMRCIAIICVVLCHATEQIYKFNLEFIQNIGTLSRVCGFFFFSVGRLGVPFFLFISGYLLLGRKYDTEGCFRFWKRNLLPLLVTTEIWIILYNFFLSWYNKTPFSLLELLCNMLMLKNVNLSHFWYMPMIFGVYLFLPILSNLLQMFDKKVWSILLGVSFVYLCVVPLINICYQIMYDKTISTGLDLQFLGGYYGMYLILGYFVKRGDFNAIKTRVLWIVGIIMFLAVIGTQLLFYNYDYSYKVWYNWAFLMISALCFFVIISRISRFPFLKYIKSISYHSFSIYLIHNLIRMLVSRYTSINNGTRLKSLRVILLFVIMVLISWVSGILLSRVPKIGRILTGENR